MTTITASETLTLNDLILSRFFVAIGITPSRMGFNLLKSSVFLYLDGKRTMREINGTLSNQTGKTKEAIERAVRSVIETSAERNTLFNINAIVGFDIVEKGSPIPAKEFIALVSECMLDPLFRQKMLSN